MSRFPHGELNAVKNIARGQKVTGIPVPGNTRENQLDFFPLDLEKSFYISRSRLETRD